MDTDAHRLSTWDGRKLAYEILLVAVGAQPAVAVPGSVTRQGPRLHGPLPHACCASSSERRIRRVAFAVPGGASWPLPLYELALMTAAHVAERGLRKVELSLVTPGAGAARAVRRRRRPTAVRELLDERGIEFHGGRYPSEARDGELRGRAGAEHRRRPRGEPAAPARTVLPRAAA